MRVNTSQFLYKERKQIMLIRKTIEILKPEVEELKYECFENEKDLKRIELVEEQIRFLEALLFEMKAPTKEHLDKEFI